ncbi:hypothetical protein TNCV_678291 [Trichonephila clavipes]|nr:hypothetical protein TNCV_678291 [Trichonephila clavipes]
MEVSGPALFPPTLLGRQDVFHPFLVMSVQRILKLEEALDLLNSLDLDESDIEIAVLPDVSELTDEDEGDNNEVNTDEITIKDVPGSLEV